MSHYFSSYMVLRRTGVYILLLLGLALLPVAGQARVVDDFDYASQKAAQAAWKPSPSSPQVMSLKDGSDGLRFPCTFSKDSDRMYWDHDVKLDLLKENGFSIDLDIDDPTLLRSPMIYFRSGGGWYAARLPLRNSGRQQVRLLKGDFSIEGNPAGWNKIDRVRVSAWKARHGKTTLTIYSIVAERETILIVRNTLSTDDTAEKAYAGRVTDRLSRWLKQMSIPHGVVTDQEVIHGALMGARIAILGYNPHPPPREIESLRVFLKHGGRLIVFYGADPNLAELLSVELGEYKRSDILGTWSSMVFAHPSYWTVPERVYQDSANIMSAKPASREAQVIARWENSRGRRSGDAAWIASRKGLWMTHVPLEDDATHKREMLVGLLGTLDPAVWVDAARGALIRVGQVDSFGSFAETHRELSAAAANSRDRLEVRRLLADSKAGHTEMKQLYDEGEYREAYLRGRSVRESLIEAFGRVQHPKKKEFRGVWDHEGTGWYPGDWDRTCRELADHGITAVFPNMMWAGLAHYPSRVLPKSTTAKKFGDQISKCLKAAHNRGIEVHIWKVCWKLGNAPADFVSDLKKQGRLQMSASGETAMWLCPSHADNIELELNAIKEVVREYGIDGIHLDYIRYPNSKYCYCKTCQRHFEKWLARKIPDWPRSVRSGGALAGRYKNWRAGRITAFVRAVREQVRRMNSEVEVSAAVWGSYPDTIDSIGQDWGYWLKKDYVDFVCPMNYTVDNSTFRELTQDQVQLTKAPRRIYPGLGVTADESQLGADQVIEQILILRELGAGGFMLFDMSHTLRLDTLPTLSLGITRDAK